MPKQFVISQNDKEQFILLNGLVGGAGMKIKGVYETLEDAQRAIPSTHSFHVTESPLHCQVWMEPLIGEDIQNMYTSIRLPRN